LLLADLLAGEACILAAIALAAQVNSGAAVHAPGVDAVRISFAIAFPAVVAISGLYRAPHRLSWRAQASVGVRALAWSIGVSVGTLFFFANVITWDLRLVLLLHHALLGSWLLAARPAVAMALGRALAKTLQRCERVLLIGGDSLARDIARSLTGHSGRVQILGFAYPEAPRQPSLGPFYRAELSEVPALARDLGADLIVVARPDLPRDQIVRLSDELVAEGRRVNVVANVFNRLVDSVPFETNNGVPLVPVGLTPLHGTSERMKRFFDVIAMVAGSLLVAPLLLLLALLVRLSSPGPIIYTQRRIGRKGRPFDFYKFRTMRVNSDDGEHRRFVEEFLKNGDAAARDKSGNKIYKLVDDARVTPIGRFLRRTSLDELPQLINVLRGEMSLVGPRPCLPFEWNLYQDWQKRRLSVTPGMTGLWQVTGRSYVTFEDMVLLDLFYIANWSLAMDLRILVRTIPVVIWGKGGM
jgi:exopolysaccharide biosynthesis polyprenyl glycosylphosphotransferase